MQQWQRILILAMVLGAFAACSHDWGDDDRRIDALTDSEIEDFCAEVDEVELTCGERAEPAPTRADCVQRLRILREVGCVRVSVLSDYWHDGDPCLRMDAPTCPDDCNEVRLEECGKAEGSECAVRKGLRLDAAKGCLVEEPAYCARKPAGCNAQGEHGLAPDGVCWLFPYDQCAAPPDWQMGMLWENCRHLRDVAPCEKPEPEPVEEDCDMGGCM